MHQVTLESDESLPKTLVFDVKHKQKLGNTKNVIQIIVNLSGIKAKKDEVLDKSKRRCNKLSLRRSKQ